MENNNNTKPKRRTTVAADVYTDLYTCKQMPISDPFFERLAIDFTNWANNDNKAFTMRQFPFSKGIPLRSFMRWCKTKKPLKDVYEDVKLMLATRREVGMITGELKEKSNMHMMHRYDNAWKEADMFHTRIRVEAMEEVNKTKIANPEKLVVVISPLTTDTGVPHMRRNADVIAEKNNNNITKEKE